MGWAASAALVEVREVAAKEAATVAAVTVAVAMAEAMAEEG